MIRRKQSGSFYDGNRQKSGVIHECRLDSVDRVNFGESSEWNRKVEIRFLDDRKIELPYLICIENSATKEIFHV